MKTIHMLMIPDDPRAQRLWLDRQLVSLHLQDLVAELLLLHGREPGPELAQLLGSQQSAVLADGVQALTEAGFTALLRHPGRLLELQDLILQHGGAHWERLAREDTEVSRLADAVRDNVQHALSSASVSALPANPPQKTGWPWKSIALSNLAMAAALLLAVYFLRPFPSAEKQVAAPTGWGWNREDALAPAADAAGYLQQLGDAAQDWFKKRPTDAANLAKRISEYRQGCSRLLLARHESLTEEDRTWLRERCRKWSGEFDEQLRNLENGADPMTVRDAVDGLTQRLTAALQERSRLRAGAV